jgi:NAD+ synthase
MKKLKDPDQPVELFLSRAARLGSRRGSELNGGDTMSPMPAAERIAGWMRRCLSSSGTRGFVVGLSGGLDSAVVARLAQLAAPGAVVGLLLPCHSDPIDERDALAVAKQFSLPTTRIDLSKAYDSLAADGQAALDMLRPLLRAGPSTVVKAGETAPIADDPRARIPTANIKPRLRMTMLYFVANSMQYLVAGTGNKSELSIGYFTKHGDGGADILPLGHLVKSEVRALGRELQIPRSIIEKTPSAGLWPGQSDEEEMGFTYANLERYLDEGPQGVSPALAMRIERLARATEHKRQLPPMPDHDNRGER